MLDKEAYYLMLISLWLPVAALKNIVKGLGIDPNGRQFSKPKQSLCCPDWLGFLGRKPLLELTGVRLGLLLLKMDGISLSHVLVFSLRAIILGVQSLRFQNEANKL